MLAAIGSFSIMWSMMEMGLEFLAVMAFHQFGGKGIEKEAPIKLSRKISHIRITANKSEEFKPWADEALSIMDDLQSQIDNRHNLIHGCVQSVAPNGTEMTFVVIAHDKRGFHTGRSHKVTLEQLVAATKSVKAVAHKLLTLSFKLVVATHPSHEVVDELREVLAQHS